MINKLLDELEDCIDEWFPTKEIKVDVWNQTVGDYYGI